jgi:hypothetical protein
VPGLCLPDFYFIDRFGVDRNELVKSLTTALMGEKYKLTLWLTSSLMNFVTL